MKAGRSSTWQQAAMPWAEKEAKVLRKLKLLGKTFLGKRQKKSKNYELLIIQKSRVTYELAEAVKVSMLGARNSGKEEYIISLKG